MIHKYKGYEADVLIYQLSDVAIDTIYTATFSLNANDDDIELYADAEQEAIELFENAVDEHLGETQYD